jgi:hypothetical protein
MFTGVTWLGIKWLVTENKVMKFRFGKRRGIRLPEDLTLRCKLRTQLHV